MPLAIAGACVALVTLELCLPLRRATEPPAQRNLRNLAVAGISAAVLRVAQKPLLDWLATRIESRRVGLLQQFALPKWLELSLAVVLMDYTLYLWHVLTHRVPLLWRFHRVHHFDRDLSASTALRFHFGELLLSIPWRAAQMLTIGVGRRALSLWQNLLLLSVLFHHSNVRLPKSIERHLVPLLVTPRMHGIHHSRVAEEIHSNWSSGLTVWDRMHGTLRLEVPQDAIVIGVPDQTVEDGPELSRLLVRPFERQHRLAREGQRESYDLRMPIPSPAEPDNE
jgi:sterol desaturase/sphingolipid hydroxylase (fatty acid hydroxylase superfamily)